MISGHIGHNNTPREVRSTPYILAFVETFNKALKALARTGEEGYAKPTAADHHGIFCAPNENPRKNTKEIE